MKEEDVLKFLAAGTHLGGTNLDFQMEHYVYKRKSDGKKHMESRIWFRDALQVLSIFNYNLVDLLME